MKDADVLSCLWESARRALEASGGFVGYFPGDTSRGEFCRYPPEIRLYREVDHFPVRSQQPDLVNQPALDACILAHEYGHFISWKHGLRPAEYVSASRRDEWLEEGSEGKPPLTLDQVIAVAREERRALRTGGRSTTGGR